jgi:hypothetical protein
MDLWKKPGQYTLKIPDCWAIDDVEDSTELVPEKNDAAIHVSLLRKKARTPPNLEDTIMLVENFAQKNKLHLVRELDVGRHGDICICIREFAGPDDDLDQPRIWLVKGLVGWHKGILGTLCLDESGGSSYTEGLEILHSLILEET